MTTRRRFLRRAASAALAPFALTACSSPQHTRDAASRTPPLDLPAPLPPPTAAPNELRHAQSLYPAPNLDDSQIMRFVAGIRPYRRGSIRLEPERLHDLLVIHNYGHGGAGVTLSWGCAEETLRLLRDHAIAPPSPRTNVAVLGSGVNGLSCALVLREAGYAPHIYAADFPPHTTSNLAGAQWAPSFVAKGTTSSDRSRFDQWLRASYTRFQTLRGNEYGVFDRINFTTEGEGMALLDIPDDLPPSRATPHHLLPIERIAVGGRSHDTMLIEPPIYLARLLAEIDALGIPRTQRRFNALEELHALDERTIINCTGLGARHLCNDSAVIPVRGQLVHMQPQELNYLLSMHNAYMFPRRDALVLGGTIEHNVSDDAPRDVDCRAILNRHRAFFA